MIKRKPASDAPSRRGEAAGSAPPSQLAVVRELARIAAEFELEEIEFEPAGRIRICRRNGNAASTAAALASAAALPSLAVSPAGPVPPPAPGKDDAALFITSPFVGTFYRAASPEAASFADVGQDVRKGQVVCIIEAMKLMNEIESEVDGKITDVLVKNGEHVEYGQQLFRVAKP